MVLPPLAGAQETQKLSIKGDPEAWEYLDIVRRRYDIPNLQGLMAFNGSLWLRETSDPELVPLKDKLRIDIMWEFPVGSDAVAKSDSKALRERMQKLLKFIWYDICSGGVFGGLEMRWLFIEKGDDETILRYCYEDKPRGMIKIDNRTKLTSYAEKIRRGKTRLWEPTYVKHRGLRRLVSKKITLPPEEGEEKGEVIVYRYENFQRVNKFELPLVLIVEKEDDRLVFDIEWYFINRQGAMVRGNSMQFEQLKELVEKYLADYDLYADRYPNEQLVINKKNVMTDKLEESGHEIAARALAEKSLKDENPSVRKKTIGALGRMKCRITLPDLLVAFEAYGSDPEFSLVFIEALGNMGDPSVIPYLMRDFWAGWDKPEGPDLAVARVRSLGLVRTKLSVEALIGLMQEADEAKMEVIGEELDFALEILTSQYFGRDVEQWQNWWKKNQSSFSLEEDSKE
ncbi:MAG: HEAT repeat domain-containing protein [Planctomycetota bacterium]